MNFKINGRYVISSHFDFVKDLFILNLTLFGEKITSVEKLNENDNDFTGCICTELFYLSIINNNITMDCNQNLNGVVMLLEILKGKKIIIIDNNNNSRYGTFLSITDNNNNILIEQQKGYSRSGNKSNIRKIPICNIQNLLENNF